MPEPESAAVTEYFCYNWFEPIIPDKSLLDCQKHDFNFKLFLLLKAQKIM